MPNKLKHSKEFKRGWDLAIEHLKRNLKYMEAKDILV